MKPDIEKITIKKTNKLTESPLTPQVSKGDILTLDLGNGNHDYLVLEANGDIVKLFCLYNVANSTKFGDSQNYFGSKIDQYLENKFYSSLSPQVQTAIIPENINQYEYDPDIRSRNHESFADFTTQKVIGNANRNIYLLDVADIEKYFNNSFTSKDLQKLFPESNWYWLRSADSSDSIGCWYVSGNSGYVGSDYCSDSNAVRPAFTINLSKILFINQYEEVELDEDINKNPSTKIEPKIKSNGIYSVLNNKWIKEPVKTDIPDINQEEFNKLFSEWEDKYNNFIYQEKITSEEVNNFIEEIYNLRKDSIESDGEYGIKNLVFKELRNKGYLDNLKYLKNQLKSKELSLESLTENNNSLNINIKKGDIIELGKQKLLVKVLKVNGNNAEVITWESICNSQFGISNNYKLSQLSKICNRFYDKDLKKDIRQAIIPQNIIQFSYTSRQKFLNKNSLLKLVDIASIKKQDQFIANVYILDIMDILSYFNNQDISGEIVKSEFNIHSSFWLRSAHSDSSNFCWYVGGNYGYVYYDYYDYSCAVRPAFTIDLSKVSYINQCEEVELDEDIITNNLEILYHGSLNKFNKFNSPINWFTTNEDYAKQFANLGNKNSHYLYTCKININNPYKTGNTGDRIFDLLPIKPYKLSEHSKQICKDLNITDDEFKNLINYTSAKYINSNEAYKLHLHTIARLPQFKDMVLKAGYDSIESYEDNNLCYGVFNPEQIKIIDIKEL